ncbi:DUF2169 family type VI secretion system accessory protein [Pyxidicoccus trucidator]|uniref:DUF2169 family type VI secretion system accessory protein n=1 Tax=Pyxidicoccus trucidator TaxID=2709662 RepID=UPI0013DC4BB1|nr:DUF2169 domain-containing protein [Pyxidicoccus trucidator]
MLQVLRDMPFVPGLFLFPDEKGVETLYAVVKATFSLHGDTLRVAEEQAPILAADEHWGAPETSSLKYASEAHLRKPGTDVVLVGAAHAPGGKPVSTCLVSVAVGPLKKVLQVFGERVWTGGLLSPGPSRPEPFVKMPLIYERAFGGLHVVDAKAGRVLGEPRNPVGRGFRGKSAASEMLGQPLPNVEDPGALIGSISDTPAPMGVGFVAPGWEPRRSFAGTYDEAWQRRRAPFLPVDFKPEFFRAASAGLGTPSFLRGGEPVHLVNVSPRGVHRFALPRCGLDVRLTIAGRSSPLEMRLETVLLEPSESRVCLLWRGALACDKKVLQVEEAVFRLDSLEGAAG